MNTGTAQVILPTGYGWEGYRPLENDERLAAWAAKYYSAGHHRRIYSTARKPQASDTAAKRQDTTLAIPLEQRPPAHGGFAECAQIMRKADASVGSLPLPAGVPSESPPGSASGVSLYQMIYESGDAPF